MSEKRRLIFSIVQFLNRELSSNDNSHSEDAKESLEVGASLTISYPRILQNKCCTYNPFYQFHGTGLIGYIDTLRMREECHRIFW